MTAAGIIGSLSNKAYVKITEGEVCLQKDFLGATVDVYFHQF